MKKKRKTVIIIVTSVAVLLLAFVAVNVWTLLSQQKEMTPLDNQEIIPGVFAIRNGFVNIFLIKQGDSYIAIDAGMSASQTRDGLYELGISADEQNFIEVE